MTKTLSEPTTATRSHEHEFEIDAPPEKVWNALTTAEELVHWFPLDAAARPGVGGSITYGWGPEFSGNARILVWEPPQHLRTSWMETTLPAELSEAGRQQVAVDYFLEGKGGKTVLRLVHSGFGPDARWDEEYHSTRRGWPFELASLKHYLEHHAGTKRRAFWLRQSVALSAAQVWAKITAPGGLVREGWNAALRAGDAYRIVLAGGDVVEGRVLIHTPPTDFAGSAENLKSGLFRFGFETCMGGPEAHLWLSTWGVEAEQVAALETRWRGLLAASVG